MACEPFALSPPARTLPLESAATLEPARVAVQAAAGSALGGPYMAAVRARVGLTTSLEAQLEGSYLHYPYRDERTPHIGAGRAGVKLAPIPHLGLVLGLGAGGHTHGAFLAPDAGVVLAYENPDLVPWFALRFGLSAPLDPQTVVVRRRDRDPEVLVPLTPRETTHVQLSAGLRIPILVREGPLELVHVHLGGAWTYLDTVSTPGDIGFVHGELGLEVVLDAGSREPAPPPPE